jgi:hypothetical protein
LLGALREAVQQTYARTEIHADGQIVKLLFSDGMKFELLPALRHETIFGTVVYQYPDSNMGGKWLTANPKAEQAAIKKKDDASNGLLRDTCKHIRCIHQEHFRSYHLSGIVIDSFVYQFIMQLDFVILLIISHKVYFSKGGINLCGVEVYSSSLKKINLKKSLQKLQKNLQNSREAFKKQSKQEKLTIIIFTILSLIWNTLSVLVVLVVAKINHTLIECIFILTSFWLSKKSFGKPFHFNSMAICFIVSNLTYYFLNRVTTPLGISIIIPILLGVGLSYVTSKFVKKTYKPLYRGMPKDLFEETILQVTEKDSDKYKICYEFYIDKKSDLSLSYKYNYSVSGIRKIKDRINEKIKRL